MKKSSLFFFVIFFYTLTYSQKKLDRLQFNKNFNKIILEADNKKLIISCSKFIKQYKKHFSQNDSIIAKAFHVLGRTYWYNGDLELGIICTKQAININSIMVHIHLL